MPLAGQKPRMLGPAQSLKGPVISFLRNETIPDARLGADEFRMAGAGFELFAEVRDVNPEIVGLVDRFWPPNLREKLAMGKHLARVHHEETEQ